MKKNPQRMECFCQMAYSKQMNINQKVDEIVQQNGLWQKISKLPTENGLWRFLRLCDHGVYEHGFQRSVNKLILALNEKKLELYQKMQNL